MPISIKGAITKEASRKGSFHSVTANLLSNLIFNAHLPPKNITRFRFLSRATKMGTKWNWACGTVRIIWNKYLSWLCCCSPRGKHASTVALKFDISMDGGGCFEIEISVSRIFPRDTDRKKTKRFRWGKFF